MVRDSVLSDTDVARYWDKNAEVWTDQVRKGFDQYREQLNNPFFYPFIGDINGLSILDAGCGEGKETRELATMGANMTGIDISKQMLQKAVEKENEKPLGITYFHCSFSKIDIFVSNRFDMVVSFMALMDAPGYEAALKEFHRVLKPGGFLVFSITHPCFITSGLGWIKDESDDSLPEKLTVQGYLEKNHHVEEWTFSQSPESDKLPLFQVPRFPRTLSGYLNPLMKSGFQVTALQEPEPTDEMCKKSPWLKRWKQTASPFLHIKARNN